MDDYVNKEVVEIDKVIEGNQNGAMRRVTTETHPSAPDGSGRRLYGMVAVSFGMLCVLQVALNISLRLVSDCLTEERDQLPASYNDLIIERDQLQKEKDYIMGKCSNPGWNKFESCWYFVSSESKTWSESRQDCVERGADLVIVNSREKQRFLFALNKRAWIGLTDRETEGSWKWVDGTPLRTSYWIIDQPNNGRSLSSFPEEDCVELQNGQDQPEKTWNDLNCALKRIWICELCNNNLL
ncbi:C-type lectin domain family 4 member E isoform X1 [Oncorhynchus tshawytscha]|uniref:C-type lectin domain-containing protein n=1 Tax=Oncorhynchus tshawytscha TaxID=74940 RepID=A0AAZ3RLZ3_ONCTS|nr:C-type lectin domain family 4 member E isoform X1 [Oncorhynchus tshawytscha]